MVSTGPTEREWGSLEKEVSEIRHDLRNQRTVCNHNSEQLEELRRDLERLKTRLATGLSILIILVTAASWLIEFLLDTGGV